MQEHQVDDQQAQETEEPVAGSEGASAEDVAASVDQQAQESSGAAAEAAPEVPGDAREKIRAAQEHIDSLNMDNERAGAKRAI